MAKTVLVVDDDRSVARFLSVLLSENGYEPQVAYDGSEGLAQVQQSKPDLIVLDVMMPKKSGLVLFRQLKKDQAAASIPILMLTGVAGVLQEMEEHSKEDTFESPYDSLRQALKTAIAEMRQEGLVKPDMFVDKPVDPDALIAKIKQLIGE